MKTNKSVGIGVNREQVKMYQTATGWVFAQGVRSRKFFAIAKIIDGAIVEIEGEQAMGIATNLELAEAWLAA